MSLQKHRDPPQRLQPCCLVIISKLPDKIEETGKATQ
jgi:hypothetical protein